MFAFLCSKIALCSWDFQYIKWALLQQNLQALYIETVAKEITLAKKISQNCLFILLIFSFLVTGLRILDINNSPGVLLTAEWGVGKTKRNDFHVQSSIIRKSNFVLWRMYFYCLFKLKLFILTISLFSIQAKWGAGILLKQHCLHFYNFFDVTMLAW